ncbi:MAG: glycoside hydrolase family 3 protein [Spirochaetales bacterium]|nr:glycoside hydrolase family 3 protein [Spirochaetales bacterium]
MKRHFLYIGLSALLAVSCRTSIPTEISTQESLPPEEKTEILFTFDEYKSSNIDFGALSARQKDYLVDSLLGQMSMEEKIGQIFMLAIRHTANGRPALELDDYLKAYMDRYIPGGLILFTINYSSPEQTRRFISDLQDHSPYPLFITTDEEGGQVSRLGSTPGMNVVHLPSAYELASTGDPEINRYASSVLAMDMRDLGFNMNMAPVADLRTYGRGDMMRARSFGNDPGIVGRMTAASVEGFQEYGISSALKHFPGHGNASGDSHDGAVASLSSLDDFYNREFESFRMGIEAGADFVLMAHIAAPSLTGDNTPASLSYKIQTEILREELGFEGIIITDAMDMGAIKSHYSPEDAALMAFSAGTDIILMPENIPSAQLAIKEAVTDGRITINRLNSSVKRILSLKFEKGMFVPGSEYHEILKENDKTEHHNRLNELLINK